MAATAALVFAGKSVATPAISFIVNKAFSYLRDWHQAEGMEAVKDRLEQRLTEIQAVYNAVNLEQIDAQKGSALDRWFWRFRDAVEGAEDALDEIDYYKLEEEAHPRNFQHQIQVRNPVTRFFRHRLFRRFTRLRHTSEGNMVKKLRKAIQDLDRVAEGVCSFLQLISRFDSRALPDRAERSDPEIGSTPVDPEIIGRNNEKNEVIMWLTNNLDEGSSTCRASTVSVFAIIGIGGIGKTTLARLVCRDLKGSRHFEKIMWVHVSDNTFSATRITKKILEVVTKNRPNADSLEALQLLEEQLNHKKFLLILDDVWEDRRRGEWEKLMAPLQTSQRGSRILLTSRMQSVADIVTSVMRSEENLQLCYRYCSIFPKGYMFKKDEFVKLWMGSGLIPQAEGGMERPEDNGERYLAQLTRKSFFSFVPTGEPYSKYYTGYYIMHDLLHDLARSVSFGECLRLDESDDYVHHKDRVRHLWVAGLSKFTVDEIEKFSFFKNLLTLVIESSSDLGILSVYALERVVKNLERLRVLILKGVPEFCFEKEVANKHLRYVSFSGMQKVQGLSKLYHLQMLNADRSIDIPRDWKPFSFEICVLWK